MLIYFCFKHYFCNLICGNVYVYVDIFVVGACVCVVSLKTLLQPKILFSFYFRLIFFMLIRVKCPFSMILQFSGTKKKNKTKQNAYRNNNIFATIFSSTVV